MYEKNLKFEGQNRAGCLAKFFHPFSLTFQVFPNPRIFCLPDFPEFLLILLYNLKGTKNKHDSEQSISRYPKFQEQNSLQTGKEFFLARYRNVMQKKNAKKSWFRSGIHDSPSCTFYLHDFSPTLPVARHHTDDNQGVIICNSEIMMGFSSDENNQTLFTKNICNFYHSS